MVEPVDGLMGMSRPELPSSFIIKKKKIEYTVGDIFYQKLAKKTSDEDHARQVFSFYFTDQLKQSFIDYNGYLLYNIRG